jgi:hypothetical protein
LWRPLLLLFGGTRGRSYLEIGSETLTARFGWAFRYRFPLSDIEDATLVRRLPWYSYSIGWRSDLRGGDPRAARADHLALVSCRI